MSDDATPSARRRQLVQGAAGATLTAPLAPALLTGCSPRPEDWRTRAAGSWIGDDAARGHRVRDATGAMRASPPAHARARRCDVLVVGSGIAGLAAARALARA